MSLSRWAASGCSSAASTEEDKPLQTKAKSLLSKLGALLLAEVLRPIEEIKTEQKAQREALQRLTEHVETLHQDDAIVKECDLASLDNQICTRIAKCRERGYTTAEDRRIVSRMHTVYRARGGNHGEENEYDIFCKLPTQEAYWQKIGE